MRLIPHRVRCVCTLADSSHLMRRLFSVFLLNEISKHQASAEISKLGMVSLHLAEYWTQIWGTQHCVCINEGAHSAPHATVHSSLNGVIFSACWTHLRLWSDLTVWCLGELQARPRSVGNQHCVGLDCSVQNYRGGWRGPGYDFPGMDPVQDCD